MAEPLIRIALTSPVTVRLDIEYEPAGDIEIWWKNSTPLVQDYVKLGTITGRTINVTPLNWTTTYSFKARAIVGSTYTAFGNETSIFCHCGYGFVEGGPPTPPGTPPTITSLSFWQQSADPDGDDVAFTCKDFAHDYLYLFERVDYIDVLDPGVVKNGWLFRFASLYPTIMNPIVSQTWHNFGTFFPAAVRKVGDNVATYDGVWFASEDFGWFWFRFWDGKEARSALMGPNPWINYPDNYRSREPSYRSLPYSMEYNAQGRIVVIQNWQDWDYPYGLWLTIQISNDHGNSWSEEEVVTEIFNSADQRQSTMAETNDGDLFITLTELTSPWGGSWYMPPVYVKYLIFKYVVGSGATLIREIITNLKNTWGGPPSYPQTGWGENAQHCQVAAEGDKVAVIYNRDHAMMGNYQGEARVFVDVSLDGGDSWQTHEVTIPGSVIHFDLEWATLIPTLTISNGNLIAYVCIGSNSVTGYRIIKSTDNGVTWNVVYTFPGITIEIPWVFQIRSDGNHLTLTGCKATLTYPTSGNMALWESLDGGDTWAGEEMIPDWPTIVLGQPTT